MIKSNLKILFIAALLPILGFSIQATAGDCSFKSGNFNLNPGQNEFFNPDSILKIEANCDSSGNLTSLAVKGFSSKWGWGSTHRHRCLNNNSCLWDMGNVGSYGWPEAIHIDDQNNIEFELKMQSSVFWEYSRN